MKIFIGSDHRGLVLKTAIIETFGAQVSLVDAGSFEQARTDYPLYADMVCRAIQEGEADFGILICGSGVGMAIAANRYAGIYAALCWTPEVVRCARADDGMNVLVLAADFATTADNVALVLVALEVWRSGAVLGERYQRRLDLLEQLAQQARACTNEEMEEGDKS